MKKNVGSVDKVVRVIVGVAIILLGIIYQSWWGLVGIVPLFTALSGTCLLYIPFGISTQKKNSDSK